MGLKETVLGELADEQLSASAVMRRILQRHPLADWKAKSIEITVRQLKTEGLLRSLWEPPTDGSHDPVPLELTDDGRTRLRESQRDEPRPPAVREDLLLQIAGSDEADLPTLEAVVRARIASTIRLAETADGQQLPSNPASVIPWRERRLLVARALDIGVLDGFARGLRRAHAEIVDAHRRRRMR